MPRSHQILIALATLALAVTAVAAGAYADPHDESGMWKDSTIVEPVIPLEDRA